MTTPTYRTRLDAERERGIADTLEAAWRILVLQLDEYSPVDWLLVRGRTITGVAELKWRKQTISTFPDVWLSVAKRDGLLALAGRLDYGPERCLFVVRWDGAIGWVALSSLTDLRPVTIKRDDRPAHTAEPGLLVPVSRFELELGAGL